MKPSTQQRNLTVKKTTPRNWLDFICDDSRKLAIPIGPRFQADLPALTENPYQNYPNNSDSSKWLGTNIWLAEGRKWETSSEGIGKGRSEFCQCICPRSVECVRKHINEKKIQLQAELGPAFWKSKFDSMGEEVSKLWNSQEQKKFEDIMKMNSTSRGETFIKSALDYLPCHSRENIISYYWNVYIPRRMSMQTRSGCTEINTDDESKDTPCSSSKSSRKRLQANRITSNNCKYETTKYLTGRR